MDSPTPSDIIQCIECKLYSNDTRRLPCTRHICLDCVYQMYQKHHYQCAYCETQHHLNKFRRSAMSIDANNNSRCRTSSTPSTSRDTVDTGSSSDGSRLEALNSKLKHIGSCMESPLDQIDYYCEHMKNEIDICIESQIIELNKVKEKLYEMIDNYNNDCKHNFELNKANILEPIENELDKIKENISDSRLSLDTNTFETIEKFLSTQFANYKKQIFMKKQFSFSDKNINIANLIEKNLQLLYWSTKPKFNYDALVENRQKNSGQLMPIKQITYKPIKHDHIWTKMYAYGDNDMLIKCSGYQNLIIVDTDGQVKHQLYVNESTHIEACCTIDANIFLLIRNYTIGKDEIRKYDSKLDVKLTQSSEMSYQKHIFMMKSSDTRLYIGFTVFYINQIEILVFDNNTLSYLQRFGNLTNEISNYRIEERNYFDMEMCVQNDKLFIFSFREHTVEVLDENKLELINKIDLKKYFTNKETKVFVDPAERILLFDYQLKLLTVIDFNLVLLDKFEFYYDWDDVIVTNRSNIVALRKTNLLVY